METQAVRFNAVLWMDTDYGRMKDFSENGVSAEELRRAIERQIRVSLNYDNAVVEPLNPFLQDVIVCDCCHTLDEDADKQRPGTVHAHTVDQKQFGHICGACLELFAESEVEVTQ